MVKRKRTRRKSRRRVKKTKKLNLPPEVIGVLLLIVSGITLVSFFTPNRTALIDHWLNLLHVLLGWGQYIFWLILGILAVWYFVRYEHENDDEKWEKPVGTFLFLAMLLVIFHLIYPGQNISEPGGGGLIGLIVGNLLVTALGIPGTIVLLIGMIPIIIILISGLSLRQIFHISRDQYYRFQDWRHFRQLKINQPSMPSLPQAMNVKSNFIDRILPAPNKSTEGANHDIPIVSMEEPKKDTSQKNSGKTVPSAPERMTEQNNNGDPQWQLPALHQIFDKSLDQEISQEEIRQRVKVIEETLDSFGVQAKVREINQGPAVTQFSLEPLTTKDSKGNIRKVRVSRIVNLSNDLALALAAAPIRIEAPIPGRPYVGLEVPNSSTNVVTLRSLMESPRFHSATGPLKLTLGQNVAGRPVIADLSTMPHLLIAGATGSGKSVCINAIVASFLSTHTPNTLRLLMIDPKMVELVNYNNIPHLLAPVVTELEKVIGILSWATREMDKRYKLFAREGVRNIVAYNEKMTKAGKEVLPYIVIIIDELADLMMMSPDEIERMITRLAQMARATGMHMIIATQRPSVDVVTGLIKANFPARVAFAVSSQIDSRVILDTPGAERLLGKGDLLYMASDSVKLQRLQGVFVSDKEINSLTHFWRGSHYENGSRGPVEIDKDLVQQPLWAQVSNESEEKAQQDELFDRALEIIQKEGKASISLLQRRLRVGYTRAARLIDDLEEKGIIGPDEGGGRTRKILNEKDIVDEEAVS